MKHLYHHPSTLQACRRFCVTLRTKHCKASNDSSNVKVMHRENNARVTYILRCLERAKLTPKFRGTQIIQLENVRTATMEEITNVHSRSYISSLEKITEEAKSSESGYVLFESTEPSYVTAKTLEESLVAAGTGLSVIDSVVAASKIHVYSPIGFALIRPPGNHAVPNGEQPMGHCDFNNIAIAARYAQRVHGLKRVFIIDFDVHHGNGTNDAFHNDPDVFFLSTHQDGHYPLDTGKIDDIGCGKGEGTTINVALPKFTGDVAMRNVFDEVIKPAVRKFNPDIILVSAGYDGHVLEGKFQMTTGGYYMLALKIKQLAKYACSGRCVFFLEGGYCLSTLGESVVESFRAFVGERSMPPSTATNFRCRKQGRHKESPSKRGFRQKLLPPYLLLRPETTILVTGICFCSSEYEVCGKC
nr:histone deacetylase 14 [Tanacetum cinerariifolium]